MRHFCLNPYMNLDVLPCRVAALMTMPALPGVAAGVGSRSLKQCAAQGQRSPN